MSLSITCPVFIVRFISAAAGWPASCVSVQLSFRPGTELASAFKGVPDPSLKVYFLAKSGFSAFLKKTKKQKSIFSQLLQRFIHPVKRSLPSNLELSAVFSLLMSEANDVNYFHQFEGQITRWDDH